MAMKLMTVMTTSMSTMAAMTLGSDLVPNMAREAVTYDSTTVSRH
jgi:hypothetical protein